MTPLRTLLACALTCAALTTTAAPSFAIVGGTNAAANEFPAVAQVAFGIGLEFQCTGTLISPDTVLTAGHCSSMTSTAIASPASWPAAAISVRIGNVQRDTGGEVVPVSRVIMQPNYIATDGHDISLLRLSRNATKTPVKVAGAGETALWAPATMEQIVGWGATSEGGSSPSTLKKASVPIVADATCDQNYGGPNGIDETTMICAGYPQGGTDTCQGDSGGPMFGGSGTAMRVVGATSWGQGCARPNKPGVYARVGDQILREWIRSQDADGVN